MQLGWAKAHAGDGKGKGEDEDGGRGMGLIIQARVRAAQASLTWRRVPKLECLGSGSDLGEPMESEKRM